MLTNSETTDDDRIVAKCYVELGNVTKEKGEYDESLRYHRKSMEIFERIDDALSVADSHLNIAEVYKAKGELKRAMSEYEKGLTLYEDVYVEDVNKNSDSGTDVSLNSSSFSDLQHTRSLSKSDETLPQTTLINSTEKNSPVSSPRRQLSGAIHTSTSSLDLPVSSTKDINKFEDVVQLTASIDDSSLIISKRVTSELQRSLSSSSIPDLRDLDYATTVETTPEESDILEIDASFLPPVESMDPLLFDTNLEDIDNNHSLTDVHENTVLNNEKQINNIYRLWHNLPSKQFLIIILSIFLTGVLFWSLYNAPIKSLLSCSSSDFYVRGNSRSHNYDDLSEQLRKMLTWRKDSLKSLNKDNRRIIEEFLTSSDSRTKISVDKFQRILDMLDLKIVLIPQ